MFGASTMGAGIFDVQDQYNNIGWTEPGYSGTEYPSSGGGLDWQSIINQGFGAASQIFAAWGRNPTQQTGVGGVPIGGGYSPAQVLGAAGQLNQNANLSAQQQAALLAANQSRTNSLDGIFGSLTTTISNNPLIFAAGAVGLYLLFREPPRRR